MRSASSCIHRKLMDIILNQVAIWQPCGSKTLNARPVQSGLAYRTSDSPVYQKTAGNLIRYAKDYAVDDVKFCLFLRTDCANSKLVERALDSYAQKLSKDYILDSISKSDTWHFEYTPYLFNAKSSVEEKV